MAYFGEDVVSGGGGASQDWIEGESKRKEKIKKETGHQSSVTGQEGHTSQRKLRQGILSDTI